MLWWRRNLWNWKFKKLKFSFAINNQQAIIVITLSWLNLYFNPMTDIKQKKENVKMQLKDLRQNLKKMHLSVTEELILPQPDEIKILMHKMDQLLKLIESK